LPLPSSRLGERSKLISEAFHWKMLLLLLLLLPQVLFFYFIYITRRDPLRNSYSRLRSRTFGFLAVADSDVINTRAARTLLHICTKMNFVLFCFVFLFFLLVLYSSTTITYFFILRVRHKTKMRGGMQQTDR
jgi:hypothetical protein